MAINGNYKITFGTAFGKQEADFTFITDGDILAGTATYSGNSQPLRDGKITGNDIEFIFDAKTPMGKIKTTVKATIDDKNIKGVMKMAIGKTPFEGIKID